MAGASARWARDSMRRAAGRLRRRLLGVRAALTTPPDRVRPGHVAFRCNICGAWGEAPESLLRQRETPSCRVCGSNQRFRALVAALQDRLLGTVAPLRRQQPRRDLAGLGMSDASVYAGWLGEKFAYTNTFFHARPFLDIQRPDPRDFGRLDFIVTSDVLEHVQPPVATAFANLRALLRPGGLLVLTVPYAVDGATVEHYPELHDFRIEGEGAQRRLLNRTRDGRAQAFDGLCFHGGDGATLELRVFALPDLRRLLEAAGFVDIRVHDGARPDWGILPETPCSQPITAIAGPVQPASTVAMR